MFFITKLFRNKFFRASYLAWFSLALFYFYIYILRVTPAVMIEELRSAFRINAQEFATFGSFYLVAYAALQIPLGVIVDRIGVKAMSLYSIIVCMVGSLLFGLTESFQLAQLARIIIGAGSASAFMCALKYIADHFPPGNRGLLMGATLGLGMAGALLTGNTVGYLDKFINWHEILIITTLIGGLIFVFIFFCVKPVQKDHYAKLDHKNFKEIILSVRDIFLSKEIMLFAILAIGLYTPLAALTDLWGPAFIKQKFNLTKDNAASLTMMMYLGLTIGSLILPWISEKFSRLNEAIILCGFGILFIFSVIIYLPPVGEQTLSVLLVLLGFFCGAEMMCFTGALTHSKKMNSGEIIGVVNTLNMLGGAVVQQMIGWGLDFQWNGLEDSQGLRHYTTQQFEFSLSILTVLVLFCCIASFGLLKARLAWKAK
jgi:MFS family permease